MIDVKRLFKRSRVPENTAIYKQPISHKRYSLVLPVLERRRNALRAASAVRTGCATYMDTEGVMRAARLIQEHEAIEV